MEYKAMNIEEFVEFIILMPPLKIFTFCNRYNNLKGIGENQYAFSKAEWLGSKVLLIGGYEKHTECLFLLDITIGELKDCINDFITKYFRHESICYFEIWVKID